MIPSILRGETTSQSVNLHVDQVGDIMLYDGMNSTRITQVLGYRWASLLVYAERFPSHIK